MGPKFISLAVLGSILSSALMAAPPEAGADRVADSPKAEKAAPTVDYAEIRRKAIGLKFDTFQVRAKTYNKVVITGIDDVGVKIRHEAGTARLKFVELPSKMRKQFGYDPNSSIKAKEVEKAKGAEVAKLTDEQRKKLMEKEKERQVARGALAVEEQKAQAAKEIKVLEAKIRKMELGITQAKAEARGLMDRAGRYRSEANQPVTRRDRNGNFVTEIRVSKGKLKMADNFEKKAQQEEIKIEIAKDLIDKYDDQIRDLKRFLKKK